MLPYYKSTPFNEKIQSAVSEFLAGRYEPSINQLHEFETEFAKYLKVEHCVGLSSGSASLHLALMACNVGPGDEVITVPNPCTDVSDFILWCGAKPIFVDVDPTTFNINTDLIESAITSKTKAIIPVHMYGHPVDMDPVLELSEKYSIDIIEDAAQAVGARYKGKQVGTMCKIGVFSFTKNLGGFGGGIVTNDGDISSKVKMLRHFGRRGSSPRQEVLGYRYTTSNLYSLINKLQLKELDLNNEKRCKNAKIYRKLLQDISEITLPIEKKWAKHVYFHFVIRSMRRNDLVNYFLENGVELRCHYPIPIYKQGAYKKIEYNTDLYPVTEKVSEEVISLPPRPNIQDNELEKISDLLHKFYNEK